MGILTGLLAGLTVLPTAIALYAYYTAAERDLAARQVKGAAAIAAAVFEDTRQSTGTGAIPDDARTWLTVDALYVLEEDGNVAFRSGETLHPNLIRTTCAEDGSVSLLRIDGDAWATSCRHVDGVRVVAAVQPASVSIPRVLGLVLLLSTIVGIVTALGVLRVLAPLSRVSTALDRVGAGERGVEVRPTGLPEFDELVLRLNAAARAVEAREDDIVGRIQSSRRWRASSLTRSATRSRASSC